MFQTIDPKKLDKNLFSLLGDRWALVTAGTAEQCNTMTVSWGGTGILWNQPVVTIYLRPERYTKEFVDREEYFTLAFFGPEHHDHLALCGSKSGRDIDKVKECGFTVKAAECGAPYFEQAQLVLVCRKRFVQAMEPEAIPQDVKDRFYREKDYHVIYIGEIVEVLVKE